MTAHRTDSQSQSLRKILERIDERLKSLDEKIDELSQRIRMLSKSSLMSEIKSRLLDAETLLSLPDHLRKTAMSISKFGEATAAKIAKDTGRARAAESDYLNQLVGMNYLCKKRVEKQVVFYVKK